MNYIKIGTNPNHPWLVFAHGWGRTHSDFIPLAETLAPYANSLILDLPGFGNTPPPPCAWGTRDYADHIADFLATIEPLKTNAFVWVGHSFGGRIGLRLAARDASPIAMLCLIASPGVPYAKPFQKKANQFLRQTQFKLARAFVRNNAEKMIALENKFGSVDYINSRKIGMRDTFVKIINENHSNELGRIDQRVYLIYAENDIETPPAVGVALAQLLPRAELLVCSEFDHHSLLTRGVQQIAVVLKQALTPTTKSPLSP